MKLKMKIETRKKRKKINRVSTFFFINPELMIIQIKIFIFIMIFIDNFIII